MPAPRLDQLTPSHFATMLAPKPPAVVKLPPVYTSDPLRAIALTAPLTPLLPPPPSANQLVPSHRAMWFAVQPPDTSGARRRPVGSVPLAHLSDEGLPRREKETARIDAVGAGGQRANDLRHPFTSIGAQAEPRNPVPLGHILNGSRSCQAEEAAG